MNASRYVTVLGLSLALVTAGAFAQGGGSGAPSNNPPGSNTNNAGSMSPGGKPQGSSMGSDGAASGAMGSKGSKGMKDKGMAHDKASSSMGTKPSMGASSPK